MRKILLFILLGVLLFSCRKDDSTYKEELKNNLTSFDNLLKYIEEHYNDKFLKQKNNQIIVFANCEVESNNYYNTIICDSKDVQEKMEDLGISEITFEKYSDKCDSNYGFNQVNFKLEKGSLDSSVFYRYEYCGTSKLYISKTVKYIPVNKNWSVFIDANFP
ncbi:MAG: hypothetical protein IM568_11855 [Flavobacterium sp.]|nr:hypothetical protein [Flavobacterium sp.]